MIPATPIAQTLRNALLRGLRPPKRVDSLANWAELHVHLPEDVSASPGRLRLIPYQRGMIDAIGNPEISRVSIVSSVRTGKTTAQVAGILACVSNEPGPAMVLLPTDSDVRNFALSDLDPIAAATPETAGVLAVECNPRNTIDTRRFPGGSLKIRAAKSPRNLRAHTVRFLFADEVDAMEPTQEGDPLTLAERRTLSFANRKIVLTSTPVHDETSNILRAYRKSDQRVFEILCPGCGDHFELLWRHIEWPEGQPEEAHAVAPCCGAVIPHRAKAEAVALGRWRATAPEVKGHAGFRINALVSPLANASWANLAAEFLEAKKSPETLQVFVNTILAEGWREAAEEADPSDLASRAEGWGLDVMPAEALVLTAGIDVQHDRLECSVVAHGRDGLALVVGHVVIWGSPGDDSTWAEMDDFLKSTWPHPDGGALRIDAAAVDSGEGAWTEQVYSFCRARFQRRIFAIKGAAGNRPPFVRSSARGVPLFIVGVDGLKSQIYQRLARGNNLRFSDRLDAEFFEQIASERVVIRYQRGAPVRQFVRVPGRRAEALDCVVYALAARHGVTVNLDARAAQLATAAAPKPPPRVTRSSFMERFGR